MSPRTNVQNAGNPVSTMLTIEQREAMVEAIVLARDEGLPGTADMLRSILTSFDVPAPVDATLNGTMVVLHFESAEAASQFHAVPKNLLKMTPY